MQKCQACRRGEFPPNVDDQEVEKRKKLLERV